MANQNVPLIIFAATSLSYRSHNKAPTQNLKKCKNYDFKKILFLSPSLKVGIFLKKSDFFSPTTNSDFAISTCKELLWNYYDGLTF